MDRYLIGVDLGQCHDHTAIAVLERKLVDAGWDAAVYAHIQEVELRLRYLERVPLGRSYPDVVERVRQVAQSAELLDRCDLIVDGTGVGRPVVDLLQRPAAARRIVPVWVTGGAQEGRIDGYYGVPKRDLIIGLQVLLQTGKLQIAASMPFRKALETELRAMRVKVTGPGREQFGAWREGEHDDLVFAVSLACWGVKKFYRYEERGSWMNEPAGAGQLTTHDSLATRERCTED
jgi:hypothetical protein